MLKDLKKPPVPKIALFLKKVNKERFLNNRPVYLFSYIDLKSFSL
jgi:hypothetical protein